jgi:DNA invertase Pin-like site-specific DNA recombinase
MGKSYGYARVSTKEQNELRQLVALHEMGITAKDLFIDKQSGKDFNRPMYKKLVTRLREGDLLYVKSIDRLGRNYQDMSFLKLL